MFFQITLYTFSWLFLYRTFRMINNNIHSDRFFGFTILWLSFLNNFIFMPVTRFLDLNDGYLPEIINDARLFASYNLHILTESSSLSFCLIIFALLLRMKYSGAKFFFFLVPILILFPFLKDTNALISFLLISFSYFLFFPSHCFGVFEFIKRKVTGNKKEHTSSPGFPSDLPTTKTILPLYTLSFIVSLTAPFCVLFSVNNKNFGMKQRWIFPMLTNFGKRVMAHPDFINFAKSQGIPVSDTLLKLKGKGPNSYLQESKLLYKP